MSDDKKIIFSMVNVSKTTPQGKQILKNIYLSFYYGAKIGIIGLNGSGKSTLMRMIAGEDDTYQGEIVFSDGCCKSGVWQVRYRPLVEIMDLAIAVRKLSLPTFVAEGGLVAGMLPPCHLQLWTSSKPYRICVFAQLLPSGCWWQVRYRPLVVLF